MINPVPGSRVPFEPGARLDRSQALAARYRRAQVFGLLLIAAGILAVALFRAEPHTLFTPGWWR